MIEGITFENMVVHGTRIASSNEARMIVEIARDVRFL